MTRESKPYLSGEYNDLFNIASVGNLTGEEAQAYSQSYLKDLENQSAIRFAAKESLIEGEKRGRMEMLEEIIRRAKSAGFSEDMIAALIP